MSKLFYNAAAVCAIAFASAVACAQDEESSEAVPAAEQGEGTPLAAASQRAPARLFHTMPFCRRVEGVCEVRKPGAGEWGAAEEGRFYPLGSSYRTMGAASRMTVQFGPEAEIEIAGDSSFSTVNQGLDVKTRTIALEAGTVVLTLPRNMPEGMFTAMAPGFTVSNQAGESRYTYNRTGDGDLAVVRCVTGALSVGGRHFSIPSMKAANEVRIRTSQDNLFTGLYGTSGDYVVNLDQGVVAIRDFETGETKQESKTLEWRMSPKTAVRIHRAVPAIGERMSVTVMTFDASGGLQNRCAFAEGRSEINTGEQGTAVLAAQEEDLAKKAAEASDTVAEEEVEEKSDDGEASGSDEE